MNYATGDAKDVFRRMNKLVQEHNECQPYLRDTVRLGPLLTLNTLVNLAIKVFHAVVNLPSMADSDEMPGVYTNRAQLSALTKCGPRTVYDHLAQLEAAGLIHKRFRGRQHDFVVWISPWIMLGESFPKPQPVTLAYEQHPGFKHQIRPILPPKNILESNPNSTKSGVKSVEKLSTIVGGLSSPPISRMCDRGGEKFILERAVDPSLPAPENILEKGGGGARPGVAHPPVPANGKGGDGPSTAQGDGKATGLRPPKPAVSHSHKKTGELPASPRSQATYSLQKELVTGFWEVVRQEFWPKDHFSDKHTSQVLNLLWTDVFGYNNPQLATDSESYTAYHRRMDQFSKARRWAAKNDWTSVMPPLSYFSRQHFAQQKGDKQKGNFHHTEAWLLADEKAARRAQAQGLLEKAVQSVLTLKPPRNYHTPAPTRIDLYGYWLNRIRSLGDAELIDAYNAGVSLAANPVDFAPTRTAKA